MKWQWKHSLNCQKLCSEGWNNSASFEMYTDEWTHFGGPQLRHKYLRKRRVDSWAVYVRAQCARGWGCFCWICPEDDWNVFYDFALNNTFHISVTPSGRASRNQTVVAGQFEQFQHIIRSINWKIIVWSALADSDCFSRVMMTVGATISRHLFSIMTRKANYIVALSRIGCVKNTG